MNNPLPESSNAAIGLPRSVLPDILALLFTMAFPSFMTWLEFVALAGPGEKPPVGLQYIFSAGKVIQFGFPLVYVLGVAGERLQIGRPTSAGIGIGIGFAVVVAAGMFLLYFGFLKNTDVLGDTPAKIKEWLEKIQCNSPTGYILMAAFVSIPHALLEEYYWRWFVFGGLRRYLPLYLAITLSSWGFMGHHVIVLAFYFPGKFWIGTMPFSLCVAAGGAVWAWLFHRTGNLYAPWLSHLLIDVAIMVVGFDLVFSFR